MSQVEIFVGNIARDISKHDLEDIFEHYGRVVRCELKQGASSYASSYGFLEFESGSDAEAAIKAENGRDHKGKLLIVQWARSKRRESGADGGRGSSGRNDRNNMQCYNCLRPGHMSRNCRESRRGGGGGGGGGRSSGGSRGSGGSSPPKAGQPGFKGAGAPRSFGGGKFYGAGSGRPYKAGGRSPGGILPALVVGGAIGLAFWPGLWLHGAYLYNYPNNYRFRNDTTDDDEDLPVICGCDPESLCGCDENDDERYVSDLVGTGEWDQLNKSLVTVADVNGTKTLLINGTLPEGTEPPVPDDGSGAAGLAALAEALGYWPMVAAALASVYVA